MKYVSIAFAAALAICLVTGVAQAKVTITAASSFPEGHLFSSPFERFIKKFNAANGSEVFIDYKGGAPAIGSPFTLGERVQRGQFDLMCNTGPYYESVVPVALATILTDRSITELRKTDWINAMQEAHEARGLHFLGKVIEGAPFQLYLRKPIDKADLVGLRLRVAPHYQPFFGALGATTVRSDLGEIYTLMENGSIDGFGWPSVGFLPDWMKITPYRVEPGFYDTDLNIIMNLETWNKLTARQKKLFDDLIAEFEKVGAQTALGWANESRAKMEAAGMKVNQLAQKEAAKFVKTANEKGWATVIKRDAALGTRLSKAVNGE